MESMAKINKNPICIATIGAGYAARLHGDAYRKVSGFDVRLKTIIDIDLEKANAVKERYGYERSAGDYESVLTDPQIDVVDICTPPNLHVRMIEQALKAGKHVICEKPLTGYFGESGDLVPIGKTVPKANMYQAVIDSMDALKTVLDESGKIFCYAENYVYSAGVQKAIEVVVKKKSKILLLKGEESLKGSGSLNTGEWENIGGGSLIRAGCHPLSSILVLKKAEAMARGEKFLIDSVVADVGRATESLRSEYEHRHIAARPNDVEDYASLSITFGDGTKAHVLTSDLVLGGTKGYVEVYTNDSALKCKVSPVDIVSSYFLDEDNLEDVAISEMLPTKIGWNNPFIADETVRGFLGELQDFLACILENKQPFSDFELAYQTMMVMYGAYCSAEEGRKFIFAEENRG